MANAILNFHFDYLNTSLKSPECLSNRCLNQPKLTIVWAAASIQHHPISPEVGNKYFLLKLKRPCKLIWDKRSEFTRFLSFFLFGHLRSFVTHSTFVYTLSQSHVCQCITSGKGREEVELGKFAARCKVTQVAGTLGSNIFWPEHVQWTCTVFTQNLI